MKIKSTKFLFNYKKKLLLIMMRSFVFLFCTTVFSFTTSNVLSQNVKVTIDADKVVTVDEVFDLIMDQTDYTFIYQVDMFKNFPKVNLKRGVVRVNKLLSESLSARKYSLSFTDDNTILIKEYVAPKEFQQQVSGTITDEQGIPLAGVNVIKVGTSTGTQTDFDGNYSLNASNGDILEFSYVGFKTQRATVVDSSTINITMEEDTAVLDEVVVVGYGTKKKINLTGALETATAAEVIENRAIANVGEALQGRLNGLNLSLNSGSIDATPSFNIRGVTTISGNGSPLILVDNIPVTADILTQMNPEDIANVSVLKDASAAAIYGGRASFGVILVTTKTGKNEKVKVTLNTYTRLSTQTQFPEFVDTPTHMRLRTIAETAGGDSQFFKDEWIAAAEAYHNDPINNPIDAIENPVYDADGNLIAGDYRFYGTVDYMKETFRRQMIQTKHDISVSGGTDKTALYASFAFTKDEGPFKIGNDDLNIFTARINTTAQVNDWLELKTRTAYVKHKYNRPFLSFTGAYQQNYFQRTYFPLFNRGLDLPVNHIPSRLAAGQRDIYEDDDINLNLGAKIDLSKNLNINASITSKTLIGANKDHQTVVPIADNGAYHFPIDIIWFPYTERSSAYKRTNTRREFLVDLFANYSKTFGEKHNVSALVGYNQQQYYRDDFNVRGYDLITESLPALALTTPPSIENGAIINARSVNHNELHWAIRGAFYRANYDYDGKYLLELSGRYDGTSVFRKGSRFGFFPSGSIGWRVSKENFMQNIDWLSDLKFRVSYGELGNQQVNENSRSSLYAGVAQLPSGTGPNILGGARPNIVGAPGLVDRLITWETVKTINYGVEAAFFNNRLTTSFDYYIRTTEGMRVSGDPLPGVLGASAPDRNAANLETKGWEGLIGWRDKIGEVNYGLKLNVWDSRAHITKFDGNPNNSLGGSYYVGEEFGQIWGYQSDGYFQTDVEAAEGNSGGSNDQSFISGEDWEAGDVKYRDLNGDGVINDGNGLVGDSGDLQIVGNSRARYNYGITAHAAWKGFSIEAFFQGVGKRDWSAPANSLFFPFVSRWDNIQKHQVGRSWTPDNPNAYFPQLKTGRRNYRPNGDANSQYVLSTAYIRLKSLSFTYTLPQKALEKLPISNLVLSFNGRNLWEKHNMPEPFDPETYDGDDAPFEVPLRRSYSLGLKVNF